MHETLKNIISFSYFCAHFKSSFAIANCFCHANGGGVIAAWGVSQTKA
ncbi:hypothetical protein HMPREF1991_00874 [Hoylesella loescheii DSM 19665 = JCM 12249 = ATCC 15930]|uniref:Uncharacterized protein n=1 Tax=Hoylesella loescheii DSM 19665 = JCM 12249 = ATCC 15930 TaxID=1122985 RepID=A0A069QLX5_HOYLO|nr:hypothetical protein HMPREF1991_00874 [Hoylesella loescheii DSM 19665 = JCM 12249 = ATCC 15930]